MELDAGDSGYVRAVRARLGLSQEQLAQRLGVSFVTVNRWEAGHTRLSRSARERLAEFADGGSSLPVPQDTLIGRETELESLIVAFERIRLLTLTGPGGIGKTRLAIELARRVRLPGERVVFVPLDAPGPAGPDARVGAAFGMRDKAGAPAGEAVIRTLASGPALVLLDGAEGAMTAHTGSAPLPAYVGRLLTSHPRIRVLITSRRLIGTPGEHAWPVPPLSDAEAARLFSVRARERSPGFEVNATASGAVGELCRRLDRLPLAIELAAAWAGTLSVEQILRLWPDLGGSGGRGGPGTLQSVAESSYALLNPAEQGLLAQLSVFAGSFTLDDVHAVVADGDEPGLVAALRGLVDASWLTALPDGPEQTYSMLSTLREYAAGLLGADSTVRDRHARHFGELARLSVEALAGPQRAAWVRRMDKASADLDAALDWAALAGEVELGLSIGASLWRWWQTTGRLAEGRRRLNYFLAAGSASDPLLIAEALHAEAALAGENGDYAHASAQALRALEVFLDAGAENDPELAKSAAQAATVLGVACRYLGEYPQAREYIDLAARYWKINGSRSGIIKAMNNQALMLLDADELDEAERILSDVLAIKRGMNDPRSVALGLHNLGHVHVNAGHAEAAREVLTEARQIAASLGDRQLNGAIACTTGDLYRTQGQHEAAVPFYREALHHYRTAGTMRDVVVALRGLGLSLYHLGDEAEASQVLHEGQALALVANDAKRIAQIREALAVLTSPGPAPAPGNSAPDLPAGAAAAAPSPPSLTPRQAEVLALLSTGLTNKDIAEALHLSIGTVERHLATIYRKVGLRNRAEATRYAIQLGL